VAPPTVAFYVSDLFVLGFSLAAVFMARRETGRRTVARWHLLMPGLLALLGTTSLVAYPELRDLLQPARWTTGTVAFLIGAVRGALIGMTSDHVFRLVRLSKAADALVVAAVQAVFATVLTIGELWTGQPERLEPTIEFVLILTAGYLLGRSVAAWFRARAISHVDIGDA
jgi:hypothetical protein